MFDLMDRATRATARVARTIHGDVEHRQFGIVRATLAVALEVKSSSWPSFTDPAYEVYCMLTEYHLICDLSTLFLLCYYVS